MRYVVWGAGHRGEIIHRILGGSISCFIDSNPAKRGVPFCGKCVISYEEYRLSGRQEVVIVSSGMSADIEAQLEADGIPYLLLDECPPEFMGFGLQTAERCWDSLFASVHDHAALYGVSLYTLWLYERLVARGTRDVVLICHDGGSLRIGRILALAENCAVTSMACAEQDGRNIYICMYDENYNDQTMPPSCTDLFDLSKGIVPYKNARIEQFRGSRMGERCFIVATGPSLRTADLETLARNGEFCISMNTIFDMFDKTFWRPDCYCVSDGLGIDMWRDTLLSLPVKQIFIGDSAISIDYASLPEHYYVFHVMTGRFWRTHVRISSDFSEKVHPSNTITNVCIQLALYMGFSEIYLLGVDFNYKPGNKNHFSSGEGAPEPTYTKSFIAESDKWVLSGYKELRAYAESRGSRIYNATRGGKLEVFERVSFDGLFDAVRGGVNLCDKKIYAVYSERSAA